MKNPFSTVLTTSGLLWTSDSDVDVVFKTLPPGMGAGYHYKKPPEFPRPTIILPKFSLNDLDQAEQNKLNAFMYHEMKHHDLSGEQTKKELNKQGQAFNGLFYWLEEARIELHPKNRTVGPAQDLDNFRASQFKEQLEKRELQKENRWGWLFTSFFYRLRNIGNLPLEEDMKKYSDMGWKILQDGRYDKAVKMKRTGGDLLLKIVTDMMKAFQLERDKEEKKEKENENDETGHEGEKQDRGSDGSNGSDPDSGESNQGDKGNPPNDHNGNKQRGRHETPEEKKENNPKDPSPADERTGTDSDGDHSTSDDSDGDHETDESGTGDLLGERRSNDDENRNNQEHRTNNDDLGSGSDDLDQRQEDKKTGEEGSDPESEEDRLQSIEEEYSAAQGDESSKVPQDKLNKDITEFGEADPFGDFHSETPNHAGDPYIPYVAEDRERIPDEYPEQFQEIKKTISFQANNLRRNIVRILMDKSQCTVERNLRRGQLDPQQFYKINSGSKRVKMQVDEGINLDAALTLLIDLSGSMAGDKATLAVKIATTYGEALKSFANIPLEILGYNSQPLTAAGQKKAERCGYVRQELVNYWIFKQFHEPWRKVCNRMGATALNLNEGGTTGGCNCDHENLLHAAKRLYDRHEANKVLIVLCDGAPSGWNGTYGTHLPDSLRAAIKKVRRSGIKLFCFGIQAEQVRKYYAPDVEIVQNLEDLDKKALNKLASFLLSKQGE